MERDLLRLNASTAALPRGLTIKLTQSAMKWRTTQKVLPKDCQAQPGHDTTWETELGAFEDRTAAAFHHATASVLSLLEMSVKTAFLSSREPF